MKIPRSVKIGGQPFKVKMKKNLKVGTQSVCGTCEPSLYTICINRDIPKTNQESTFIHEILEAICAIYDIRISHQTLSTLETALYQVLIENKLLKE